MQTIGERPVLLGVRPENITVESEGKPNVLKVAIDLVEPTGSDNLSLFKLGASEVLARLKPGACSAGDVVTLGFPAEKLLIYDEATGELVA